MPPSQRKRHRLSPVQVQQVYTLLDLGTLNDTEIAAQIGTRPNTVSYYRHNRGKPERASGEYRGYERQWTTERDPKDPTEEEITEMTATMPLRAPEYREIVSVEELPPFAGWRRFAAVVLFARVPKSRDLDYQFPEWAKLSAITPDGRGRDGLERYRLLLDANVAATVEEMRTTLKQALGIMGVDLSKKDERIGKAAGPEHHRKELDAI